MSRSELLLQVARLYYAENFSKTAISEKLGSSVTHIARLLEEARETGVVQIQFHGPRDEVLSRQLLKQYPCLREAIVVGTEVEYALQTKTLARTAAEYLDAYLTTHRSNIKIGLSGGQTVFEFVKALPEQRRNVTLFPTSILGRGDTILKHVDPIASLMVLWGKSGYRKDGLRFVTVTPLERHPDGRSLTVKDVQLEIERLLHVKKVERLYNDMAEVDLIFASLRQMGLPEKTGKRMGATAIDLLSDIGIEEKDLEGAVGDVNYSFIDKRGQSYPEWRLFLSLQADQLRTMAMSPSKRVVIIAGRHKERILRAALRGGLLNVLITDEVTAASLVSASPVSSLLTK